MLDFSDYQINSQFFYLSIKKLWGNERWIQRKNNSWICWIKTKDVIFNWCRPSKKAKGVSKNVVENIRYKEYIDVLFNKKIIRNILIRIQSKLHKTDTFEVCKISLSSFDDIRWWH